MDNNIKENKSAAVLLDFLNKAKSDKSLLFFIEYLFFCLKKIKSDQILRPDNIYTIIYRYNIWRPSNVPELKDSKA